MRCSITDLVHRGAVAHGLADDVAHLEEECISANHSRAAAESGKKPFHSVRGPPSIVGTIPNRFPVFRSFDFPDSSAILSDYAVGNRPRKRAESARESHPAQRFSNTGHTILRCRKRDPGADPCGWESRFESQRALDDPAR